MFRHPMKNYQSEDGRKFFVFFTPLSIQCAACLYVQPIHFHRDENGVVTEIELKKQDEQHQEGCTQTPVGVDN